MHLKNRRAPQLAYMSDIQRVARIVFVVYLPDNITRKQEDITDSETALGCSKRRQVIAKGARDAFIGTNVILGQL